MPAFYPEGDEPKLADPSGRSLHKINNLLKSIDAKTGSTTLTGPVTVNNEVEVTNSTGNPIPVSGTVALDATSLAALESISVTFPATQNVNVTNAGLTINDMTSGNAKTKIVDSVGADVSYITAGTAGTPSAGVLSVQGINGGVSLPISGSVETGLAQPLTDTQLRALAVPISGTVTANTGLTQPLTDTQLRAASVPISQATAANLNATVVGSGSFTAAQSTAANLNATVVGSGSFTAAQPTAANLNATVVGSGSFTAAQATASSLKAQAQILDSAGSLLTYGSTGVAGSPSSDVITVQGASAGTAVNTKILNSSGTAVTYAETGTYGSPSVDVLSVQNPQGVTATITTFTSTTASTSLVAVGLTRKALTVYNSGPGDLYISPTATCTTTNFQLKLSSGDFWECPASQVLLSHTGVFATSGTAYITNLI